MHLITMAHRGEALGVIQEFGLTQIRPELFQGEGFTLLLTGEGPFEAATLTASLLGSKTFSTVINLGIAGSLNTDLIQGEIYPVRMHYLIIQGRPQFKSFKGDPEGLDCLTSFERILSPELALPLKGVGDLVDREAWGVAMAAKNHGLPFKSFKLISDVAGTLGACEIVRSEAEAWSLKLAQFLALELNQAPRLKEEVSELPGFHFTFTTQHQYRELMRKLCLKEEQSFEDITSSLPLDELKAEKLAPKERTRILLNYLEERLDPIQKIITKKIKSWQSPLEKAGFALALDPEWEDAKIKISFEVNSQSELEEKIEALKNFSLTPYHNILEGQFHVE